MNEILKKIILDYRSECVRLDRAFSIEELSARLFALVNRLDLEADEFVCKLMNHKVEIQKPMTCALAIDAAIKETEEVLRELSELEALCKK